MNAASVRKLDFIESPRESGVSVLAMIDPAHDAVAGELHELHHEDEDEDEDEDDDGGNHHVGLEPFIAVPDSEIAQAAPAMAEKLMRLITASAMDAAMAGLASAKSTFATICAPIARAASINPASTSLSAFSVSRPTNGMAAIVSGTIAPLSRGGFVAQQDGRMLNDRASDAEALLLPAAELGGIARGKRFEPAARC
jgi:Na+(H+)/acetate symporter ActP